MVSGPEEVTTKLVSLTVSPAEGTETINLTDVLVVNDIPAMAPPRDLDLSKYPHLADLPLPGRTGCLCVQLLLGMDHPELLVPLEVRAGVELKGEPYACRTKLGWALQGPLGGLERSSCRVNFVKCTSLDDQLNSLWALEREGDDEVAPSVQDTQVLSFWERETTFVDGHYVVPIPWREGAPDFPVNKVMARNRLKSTLRKLSKTGKLDEYSAGMHDMLEQGFAEPVPVNDVPSPGRVWYLPHHAVVHPEKKKLRIVFDCAAKQGDISLNKSCLSGPDLTNKLLHVLLRFREYPVALTADVKAMYMQVRLPEGDRDSLRFLWGPGEGGASEYRMCSHVFGGIWCAASTTFALRRCLSDFPCSEAARDSVTKSMYVDDLLVSKPTIESAKEVARDTHQVLHHGGFRLAKFSCNYPEVVQEIPEEDRVICDDKVIMDEVSNKVLGLRWDVAADDFVYRSSIQCGNQVTKRSLLSAVASLYDPLGLVSPVVLPGRLLFQEATKAHLGWDDVLPQSLVDRWSVWVMSLQGLSSLSFPRCLVPSTFLGGQYELHHFSDGSMTAYGTASYLRLVSPSGEIRVCLLLGKSRVAPIKATTIPRLEMAAAVLSVRQDLLLHKELSLDLGPSTFWSDSQIVLAYIASQSRRFKVFVANRVAFIHRYTEVGQWRYVPTLENPADVASRGCLSRNVPDIWRSGPGFLGLTADRWPIVGKVCEVGSDDVEVKAEVNVRVSAVGEVPSDLLTRLWRHYSSFYRACKALAWWRKFAVWLKSGKCEVSPVSRDDLVAAEAVFLRRAQNDVYCEEITALSRGKQVRSVFVSCARSRYDKAKPVVIILGQIPRE